MCRDAFIGWIITTSNRDLGLSRIAGGDCRNGATRAGYASIDREERDPPVHVRPYPVVHIDRTLTPRRIDPSGGARGVDLCR
jgi:hypothetical protein